MMLFGVYVKYVRCGGAGAQKRPPKEVTIQTCAPSALHVPFVAEIRLLTRFFCRPDSGFGQTHWCSMRPVYVSNLKNEVRKSKIGI